MAYIPRFAPAIKRKVLRLLYMQYKPSEIAQEIGVTGDTVYRGYIPAGCPHERDKNGNIWIVGTEFREWVLAILESKKITLLGEHEAYCRHCKKIIVPVDIKRRLQSRTGIYIAHGKCPECNMGVTKFEKRTK